MVAKKKDYKKLWRERNKMHDCYLNLKSNAKRRGHVFELTFEQFQQFCIRTDYIAGKGKTKESYSIDKIINSEGYTVGNIRVMTLSDNAKKHTKMIQYDYENREFWVKVVPAHVTDNDDVPF